MPIRGTLLLTALVLVVATRASGQSAPGPSPAHAISGPRPAPLFARLPAADSVAKPTQWKKGAIIGGAALGGLGLLTGVAYLAGDNDTSVGDVALATLVGATLGAFLGGLVGGLFSGS